MKAILLKPIYFLFHKFSEYRVEIIPKYSPKTPRTAKILRFISGVLFSIGRCIVHKFHIHYVLNFMQLKVGTVLQNFAYVVTFILFSIEQDVQPVMLLSPIGILKKMVYFFVKRITGLDMEKLANSAVR